jgi:antitoxin component YwqK of YwqJK toxin-antitoxin module
MDEHEKIDNKMYSNGVLHGWNSGVIIDGVEHTGYWDNGVMDGFFMCDHDQVAKYENGKKIFKIKALKYSNGEIYVGSTSGRMKNGCGILFSNLGSLYLYPDGTHKEGMWKYDVMEGKFKEHIQSTNETLIVEYKNGRKSGSGFRFCSGGDIMHAYWKDDEQIAVMSSYSFSSGEICSLVCFSPDYVNPHGVHVAYYTHTILTPS